MFYLLTPMLEISQSRLHVHLHASGVPSWFYYASQYTPQL